MGRMETNATSVESVTVREAGPADLSSITSVINDAFRIAEGFFIDGERIDERGVDDLFKSGHFLLAQRGRSLVGCVYVEIKNQTPVRSYLGLLSVAPGMQGSGIGSLLMEFAENYCRDRQSTVMDILVVNLRKELPAFYKSRGYVVTGTSPFPPDVTTKIPCHFIEMSKTL